MNIYRKFVLPALVIGLTACNPVYNWREVRLEEARVKLMLPCKPDSGSRNLTLAGQNVPIQMTGCETDGALFALAHVEMPDADKASAGLTEWKSIMLSNMQAQADTVITSSRVIKSQGAQIAGIGLNAHGKKEDGQGLQAQAVWFARDVHLYHAVVYADKLNQEAVENFLSGIELQ
jgi:hypothetical protein